MGAKGEALAKQFEGKVRDAVAVLEKISDADWKKVTANEKWPVGVTAHHAATAFGAVAGMASALASGQSRGELSMAKLDEMNATHAKDHASCTRAETIALLQKNATTAAAVLRNLSDDQLAKSGIVLTDAPPMSVEQIVTGGLILHLDDHFGSIRKTLGQ